MLDMEVKEGLRKYREDMLDKQRKYLELVDAKAGEREIALASELFRLAMDAYNMARADGLAE
jgi:hypothetical protein